MSNEDVKVKATTAKAAKKPAARTKKAKTTADKAKSTARKAPVSKSPVKQAPVKKAPTKKAAAKKTPEATVTKSKTPVRQVKKATAPSPTPKSAKPSTRKVKKGDGAEDQSVLIHELQEQVALLTHRTQSLERDLGRLPTDLLRMLSSTFGMVANTTAQQQFRTEVQLVDDVEVFQNESTLFLEVEGTDFNVFGMANNERHDIFSSRTGFVQDAIFNPNGVVYLINTAKLEKGVYRVNIFNV